jgi:hypothetical protein
VSSRGRQASASSVGDLRQEQPRARDPTHHREDDGWHQDVQAVLEPEQQEDAGAREQERAKRVRTDHIQEMRNRLRADPSLRTPIEEEEDASDESRNDEELHAEQPLRLTWNR